MCHTRSKVEPSLYTPHLTLHTLTLHLPHSTPSHSARHTPHSHTQHATLHPLTLSTPHTTLSHSDLFIAGTASSTSSVQCSASTRCNPTSQTLNPKPWTLNPTPQTVLCPDAMEPEHPTPRPNTLKRTRFPHPQTLNPKSCTMNPDP